MSNPGKIYGLMAKIMAEIEPIAKEQRNQSQGYQFRGVDDVYAAVQAIMAKYGVFSMPTVLEDRTEDRTTAKGSALIYRILKIRYDFYADDGSSVPCTVIGEGMDSGDKASNKAMSVADKYSLLQAFKIPTREPKDPEHDSHQVAPKSEIYEGLPHQKKAIQAAMVAAGFDDRHHWIEFSHQFMKCQMELLATAIEEYKGNSNV